MSGSAQRTRIKICGITRADDARVAAMLGVDAIGLVFYPPSPRAVEIQQACDVITALPAFVNKVALFVDPDASYVEEVIASTAIDTLQFHGSETSEFCEQFSLPYIKAVRMQSEQSLSTHIQDYAGCQAFLLDTYVEGVAGGTGESFNWNWIPSDCDKPLIVAGGLGPDNVVEAISKARPYAVDVSGGVESAKGIKSHDMMLAFVNEVNKSAS